MSILQAIFLGIVQGITEFLPVSSSGHLAILKNIFHMETDGGLFFEVMLHVGTLVAIIVVYRKDLLRMIVETVHMCEDLIYNLVSYVKNQREYSALRYRKIVCNNYRKFVLLVIVATIPTAILGYLVRGLVERAEATLLVPGICLLLTAVLLLVAEHTEEGNRIPRDISYGHGFLIGLAQGCATLPGLSRSGTTIAASLLFGLDRRFAVRFSFIMAIPAIIGAAVMELTHIGEETISGGMVANGLVGAVVAGLVGYVCIKTMLAFVRKKKFTGFAVYCSVVGVIAIVAQFLV